MLRFYIVNKAEIDVNLNMIMYFPEESRIIRQYRYARKSVFVRMEPVRDIVCFKDPFLNDITQVALVQKQLP